VVNDSSAAVNNVTLAGTGVTGIPIFGLDGDGLCVAVGGGVPPPVGCPFGPTGYGSNRSFSNISPDMTTGTVNFTAALRLGHRATSAWRTNLWVRHSRHQPQSQRRNADTNTHSDDCTAGTFVTASKSSVKKGQQAAFIVALDPDRRWLPVTVNYSMSGGAVLGTDYTLSGRSGQVTIPAADPLPRSFCVL